MYKKVLSPFSMYSILKFLLEKMECDNLSRVKIRELDYKIGLLQVGEKNCITDVKGVMVGHVTLQYPIDNNAGDYICTGVTAVLPHSRNIFKEKVVGTSYVINGFGKSTGLVQLNELGRLESPIMLTNTFGVPAVTQGTLEYLLEQNNEIGETTGTINIVVGECNDSYLNSIRLLPIQPKHAIDAIQMASDTQAVEGAIGAGTGMVCFGYKGGIGCSSRTIQLNDVHETYTVGCLVLSNFGNEKELWNYNRLFQNDVSTLYEDQSSGGRDGSIIIVLATDVPLNERQLNRVAKRCGIGLGRTGSHMGHGSGDIVIAFSTAQTFSHSSSNYTEQIVQIREDHPLLNTVFTAAAEATEEAIMNSLTCAETTIGRKGRQVNKIPYRLLKSMIKKRS